MSKLLHVNAFCKGISSTLRHYCLYDETACQLSMLLFIQAQSHTGTQQTTRRPDVDGWSSGKEEALRHQLDCYRTAAKQLSVLLGHRNKEIEGNFPSRLSCMDATPC